MARAKRKFSEEFKHDAVQLDGARGVDGAGGARSLDSCQSATDSDAYGDE